MRIEPAIARGTSRVLESGDPAVSVIERAYGGASVTIALNLSGEEKTVPLDPYAAVAGSLLAALYAQSGEIAYQDGVLKLAPWGIAVLG